MRIENGELRSKNIGPDGKYFRSLKNGRAFILPFREEQNELIYDLKNRTSLADLAEFDPEAFYRCVREIPSLFSALEEHFLSREEVCWNPELMFCAPGEQELRILWLPGEENGTPEKMFHDWSFGLLDTCLAGRESNEEKLLFTVRLCQAFDGNRSFSKSISILADCFQERMLKQEEKTKNRTDGRESVSAKIRRLLCKR